jgi:tRNA A-37 threonylcarbamoyl transferase component Bud32
MPPGPEKIGDYVIEGELGAGGMAKVYRARHPVLGTRHAIKVLDPTYRENPAARQRFLDEARIQAGHLDHANIVKVTNIIATDEHAALVMELIEGGSLESRLGALAGQPGEIRRIMLAVLDAVGHAHAEGIIHRDLKPANVLLDTDGEPKVTDFGIAKVMAGSDTKKSTAADARMGTLSYMSPEQIRRAKDVTARSDIFSLGAMLYEMATGRLAFAGESDYDVMDAIIKGNYPPPTGIDPVLADVITTALDPDPAKRYASCAEMAAALCAEPRRRVAPPPVVAGRSYGLLIGVIGSAVVLGGGAMYVATRPSTPAATPIDAGLAPVVVTAPVEPPDAAVIRDHDCAGGWIGEVPPDGKVKFRVDDDLEGMVISWSTTRYSCSDSHSGNIYADRKLHVTVDCVDIKYDVELTCATGDARIQTIDKTGPGPRQVITMRHVAGDPFDPPPEPPPVPIPPRKNGSLAYCMSGFTDGTPSPCERKRPLHRYWHRHGYLDGDGACFECWDEEDDDCQAEAAKRTGFRYLGSSCNGLPHASEGNLREASVSSTSRSTTTPANPLVKPNPYDPDGLLMPF